ncbi:MAG TPA: hypothetical protein VK735_39975 [Pseudonocardia sp.]|uniref:hypothetical protein n=1 Tax=Pseudonocardia sp. TaxID=60912 RepID=UPI002C4A9540|nr:hypothetical protein [Pseudonocardia sp.]HTF53663.1 hypothetical protein [Pseudonocardia sp.]
MSRRDRFVSAFVVTPDGTQHRIGYLASEGWFCCAEECPGGKRCKQIKTIQKIVPPMEPPKGATP